MPAMFTFETELERGDDMVKIEVEYGVSSDELFINGIKPDIATTDAENRRLIDECNEHFQLNR